VPVSPVTDLEMQQQQEVFDGSPDILATVVAPHLQTVIEKTLFSTFPIPTGTQSPSSHSLDDLYQRLNLLVSSHCW